MSEEDYQEILQDLPRRGVVDLVGNPAERPVVGGGLDLAVVRIQKTVKPALREDVDAGGRDPGALLIGKRPDPVFAHPHAVGPAETGAHLRERFAVLGDHEAGTVMRSLAAVGALDVGRDLGGALAVDAGPVPAERGQLDVLRRDRFRDRPQIRARACRP